MSVFSIQVDSQGRMLVPDDARAEMGIEEGERFILKTDPVNGTLTLIRVTNPLDKLALEAIAEYEAGLTISLDDAAAELGLTIDRE
jgi:bifunctional DNA-binding transcriptional regulator/antitoxin component of YhaV-PrlF toxin-antitoxin module